MLKPLCITCTHPDAHSFSHYPCAGALAALRQKKLLASNLEQVGAQLAFAARLFPLHQDWCTRNLALLVLC